MKKLFAVVLVVVSYLLLASVSFAGEVTLAWDQNPETNLTGYKLYYSHTSDFQDTKTQTITVASLPDAANPQYTLTTTEAGHFWFKLTAYITEGSSTDESDFSDTVDTTITPQKPANLRFP